MSEYQQHTSGQGWVKYIVSLKTLAIVVLPIVGTLIVVRLITSRSVEEVLSSLVLVVVSIVLSLPIVFVIATYKARVAANLDEGLIRIRGKVYPINYVQEIDLLVHQAHTTTPYHYLIVRVHENESRIPINNKQGVAMSAKKFAHLREMVEQTKIVHDIPQNDIPVEVIMQYPVGKVQILQLLRYYRP